MIIFVAVPSSGRQFLLIFHLLDRLRIQRPLARTRFVEMGPERPLRSSFPEDSGRCTHRHLQFHATIHHLPLSKFFHDDVDPIIDGRVSCFRSFQHSVPIQTVLVPSFLTPSLTVMCEVVENEKGNAYAKSQNNRTTYKSKIKRN